MILARLLDRIGLGPGRARAAGQPSPPKIAVPVPKEIREEPISFEEIRALVGRDDPVILEIGANGGEDTQHFLDTFPSARVYCFEPEPRAIARWKAQVSDPRATLIEAAIGRENGTARFHQSDTDLPRGPATGWDLSGSIKPPKEHLQRYPWVTFTGQIDVPVLTLDTWAENAGITEVDFIWADVQGAENDLIEGGRKTLARTRFFYTEYSDRELYEGQWSLDQIAQNLPDHRLKTQWQGDALFQLGTDGQG